MPHNFTIGINFSTGAALANHMFVSHSGNDNNPGTDPNFPKRTVLNAMQAISSLTNWTLVVGTGDYNPVGIANISTKTIVADGQVTLWGTGSQTMMSPVGTGTIRGFVIRDYGHVINNAPNANAYAIFDECKMYNTKLNSTNASGWRLVKTEVENCIHTFISANNYPNYFYDQCKIKASSIQSRSYLKNCDIDADSDIYLSSLTSGGVAMASLPLNNFNNIRGGVWLDNVKQTLQQQKDKGFNVNSFTAQPMYQNPGVLDYSVLPGSPLLGAGENNVNIGNVTLAQSFTQGNPLLDFAIAQHPNIEYNSDGEIAIIDPNNTTTGIAGVEDLELPVYEFDVTRYIGRINMTGITNYINNVPDIANESNPNYLTFWLRWGGAFDDLSTRTYHAFRWGMIPSVIRDAGGAVISSNGVSGFNFANEQRITARKFQAKIRIKAQGQYIKQ